MMGNLDGVPKEKPAENQRVQRRERDSNPRKLSLQRFSRPPQSTTLPSLQYDVSMKIISLFRLTSAKVRTIFELCKYLAQKSANIPYFLAISTYLLGFILLIIS